MTFKIAYYKTTKLHQTKNYLSIYVCTKNLMMACGGHNWLLNYRAKKRLIKEFGHLLLLLQLRQKLKCHQMMLQ